jgi:hypothetical protein
MRLIPNSSFKVIPLILGVLYPFCVEAQSTPMDGAQSNCSVASAEESQSKCPMRIKAFCVDFNWGPGGPNGFAGPGVYAAADANVHYQWYKDLGINTIQTFCVSGNGYAWYRASGAAPVQPGLKHDFLVDITKLAHKDGMKVMGYFCVGSNVHWCQTHPNECYDISQSIQIPFTNRYLDYLSACIKDVLTKTDIDGFMVDWVFSPPNPMNAKQPVRWLDCEKQMYAELLGRPFPGKDKVDLNEAVQFQRRAVDRCWRRIYDTAKSTKPNCVIWLSCFDLQHPQVSGSRMFREVDWLMNENPNPESLAAVRKEKGEHTKIIQCLCGWGEKHDPRQVAGNPKYDDMGFYGFAGADPETTLPASTEAANIRNIEILRDVFHDQSPK